MSLPGGLCLNCICAWQIFPAQKLIYALRGVPFRERHKNAAVLAGRGHSGAKSGRLGAALRRRRYRRQLAPISAHFPWNSG